ncbi:2-oxo acid dehydrogenase subunit E2 [Pseudarthrobacter niigatensis]|uniref:Dihydrolipoamide acetyltransferase component of pyruvate dehydrogenase complex n=1 Tax=Pseudarthrobacter niigatensis TaxID=369935 RepID=A0AAJ1WDE8_9MICC|nr:2-oxo acid dehydrogenase subunit E2 [Pseudarthrobacter niigatensis]MDQ0146069.1 pyruvate dehydrogenase E2 component (dihydrolipoamide acetyltransferase) [Pseudarthrobacter niigatensis]MDQ0266203.1 pyruvate dehydrogenase E2 component (dihydrolipoamide acetyltransferase) [Pseudarthrobacter niigatensis]
MADFRMPSLGADMEHGKVVEWLVKPGDYVHKGDIVAAVDTDKTVMDIESFEEGVVAEFLVDLGDTVDVGTPIARITATPAELPAAPTPPAPSPKAAPPVRHLAHTLGVDVGRLSGSGAGGEVTREDVERAAAAPGAGPGPAPAVAAEAPAEPAEDTAHRVRSSPLARRLAVELGVRLADIAGTGPGGAVTEEDVLAAVPPRERAPQGTRADKPAAAPPSAVPATEPATPERQAAAPPAPQPQQSPQHGRKDTGGKAESLRQAIGALMSRSKKEIPHYYLSTTLDLAAAMAWMQAANQQRPVSSRLVPSALLLKATALAVKEVPDMNGFFTKGAFQASSGVHLGVAVALRHGGLVAPALHDADTLSLDQLMDQLRDLVGRARAGRLQRAEMADPTITVTNLGDLGVESVYGVIYPPQVAMVGFGKVMEQPWAHNGMLGIRHAAIATLSADHRVSDGLRGGRFLARIDELLQKPGDL